MLADRFKLPYKALLLFSDSTQYVRIPNLINGLTAFSISIWFCPDSINPWRWIFGQYPTPKVGGVSVGATLNNGRLRYHIRTSGTDTIKPFDGAATDMVRNKWYHLAVVYTGNFFNAFLNGRADASAYATGAVASPDSLALGAGSFNGNKEFFRGIIDDVRVYNRSLTVAEIVALYREGGYTP
jgi:hypothetical protein